MQDKQTAFRMPSELLERATRITERLKKNPDNNLMGISRASIIRLAIKKGLDAIEAETGLVETPSKGDER